MANIVDYLEWRGDVPFEIDPFNEVDALVLCELVYAPFDGFVPGPGIKEKITIESLCERFFEKYTKEELLARNAVTKLSPFIMQKMINSKRFGGTYISGFVNDINPETQSQFCVSTFYLSDGTIFVAFRGTDDSLVGWKEDFNMCFSDGTGGQLLAIDYLNNNFDTTMKKIRVGGHSKGGNFAVYGSAFCKDNIKDNILQVYNFDGPGFIPELLETKAYKSIVSRINKYIPKESIIGLLMNTKAKTTVVSCESSGINQHDPMMWQVKCNRFIYEEKVSESSILIDEIITNWSMKFDYNTRALFGDVFFSSLASASGATKLSEITSQSVKSVAYLTKEIQSLEPEKQALVADVLVKLLSAGGDGLKNSVLSKLSKNLIMRKKENTREKKSI